MHSQLLERRPPQNLLGEPEGSSQPATRDELAKQSETAPATGACCNTQLPEALGKVKSGWGQLPRESTNTSQREAPRNKVQPSPRRENSVQCKTSD